MGVVYRAYDEQLEREVALKVLPAGMLADETSRRRFRREALLLAKVNHPNVGVVFEFGSAEGVDFLVMELITGTTLDAKLARRPLSEKEVLRLGVQLADGLSAAHAQGIIHRDLKPANLRLTPDGRLKILDFGLAQYMQRESQAVVTASLEPGTHLTGTLPYMSPEQLRGEQLDARTDLWAVGAVLYELATGRRPFPQSNSPLLIDAILNKEPDPPRSVNPQISAELASVIAKCLDKEPERRYQSALEVKVDLERLPAPPSQGAGGEQGSGTRFSGGSSTGSTTRRLQIAHVLSIGIDDDTDLSPEERLDLAEKLRADIYNNQAFHQVSSEEEVISAVDNDGLSLMFFGNPATPLRFANEYCHSENAESRIRIGVHSGPVYRSKDAKHNQTATGSTINLARELMALGEAGHVLASKNFVDVVAPLGTWPPTAFSEVGEIPWGSAGTVHVFTFVNAGLGRSSRPRRLTRPAPQRSTKILVWFLAAMLVIASVTGVFFLVRRRPAEAPHSTAVPPNVRRSVAVLGFKNVTARRDADWLSTALSEMLITELAAGEKVRIVSSEDVARMKLELALPESDSLTRETLEKIRRNIGADLVVVGSYVVLPEGQLRVDMRLQDVTGGETLVNAADTGDVSHLFDLVSRAGGKLREKSGMGSIAPDQEAGVRASLPATPEAAKLYAEGISSLRVMDGLTASRLLEKAVEADPNHALAHSALAAAWASLGYDEKARVSAKSAFDLSSSLSRENRLLVEGRYREMSKEWENAAHIYRTLFDFFPDNLDYGVALARTQIRGGNGKEGLITVDAMRNLGPPLNADPRIDLAGSDGALATGDFKQAQTLAVTAAQKASAQGAKLLLARALRTQALALDDLGDVKSAAAPAEQARELYATASDRNGVASVLEVEGNIFVDGGDLDRAINSYSEELSIVREVGNKRGQGSALNNLALVLKQKGQSGKAREMWEAALATFREIDDKNNLSMTLVNLGGLSLEAGDLSSAQKTYEDALTVSRQVNNSDQIASSLTALGTVLGHLGQLDTAQHQLMQAADMDLQNGRKTPSGEKLADLGEILMWKGQLNDSRKYFQDALALSQSNGDKSTEAYALVGLGNLSLLSGDFKEADENLGRSLSIRKELGEQLTQTKFAQTESMIDQGNVGEAERLIREIKEDSKDKQNKSDELESALLLTRCLLAGNRTVEAKRELDSAEVLARNSQDYQLKLRTLHTRAAVQASLGQVGASQTSARTLLTESAKAGYPMYLLEARLLVEEFSKPRSAARIIALEKDASDKGYTVIARRARVLYQ
jgi:serine/threonine protein kinase/tetratricopeptide (TPR) repeat protein/TolB-like protein